MTEGSEAPNSPGRHEAAPWPPRVVEPPRLAFVGTQEAPLRLDTSAAPPPPPPEFRPGRLAAQEPAYRPGAVRPRVDELPRPGGPPKAVVFDPRNPSGRSRADAIFDPTDREHALRRRRATGEAMGIGAGLALLVLASSASPPWTLWVWAALAGAGGGAAARSLGDGAGAWLVGMATAGVLVALPLGGLPTFFAPFGAAALGWIAGLQREVGRR